MHRLSDGRAIPDGDDLTIGDDADLWRRIPDHPNMRIFDEELGRMRPSSAAFEDSGPDDPMSALLAEDDTPARALSGQWVGWWLAVLPAGAYRVQEQRIARDPTPEDPNHVLVVGAKTRRARRLWARTATILTHPAPAER